MRLVVDVAIAGLGIGAGLGLALPVEPLVGQGIVFIHGGRREVSFAFVDISKKEIEFSLRDMQDALSGSLRLFKVSKAKGKKYLLPCVGPM